MLVGMLYCVGILLPPHAEIGSFVRVGYFSCVCVLRDAASASVVRDFIAFLQGADLYQVSAVQIWQMLRFF